MLKTTRTNKKKSKVRVAPAKHNQLTGPPPFQLSNRMSFKLRFVSSGAHSGSSIAFSALLNCLVAMGLDSGTVSTSFGVSLFQNIKLKRIRFWVPAVVGNAFKFRFDNQGMGMGIPEDFYTDTCTNVSYGLYFEKRPNKNSNTGTWINASSTFLATLVFYVWCPVGTVMEMDLLGVPAFDTFTSVVSFTGMSTTTPGIYCPAMMTTFAPVGYLPPY